MFLHLSSYGDGQAMSNGSYSSNQPPLNSTDPSYPSDYPEPAYPEGAYPQASYPDDIRYGNGTPPVTGYTGPMDDSYRDTLPRDPYTETRPHHPDENPYGRSPMPQHLDDRHRQTPSPAGGQ